LQLGIPARLIVEEALVGRVFQQHTGLSLLSAALPLQEKHVDKGVRVKNCRKNAVA
jgi:hypothetical protein